MHTNHFFVSNLTADAVVSGSYIIQDIQFCTTRTGTPYLRATLNDATGSIRMLFWDYDICGQTYRCSSSRNLWTRSRSSRETKCIWPRRSGSVFGKPESYPDKK